MDKDEELDLEKLRKELIKLYKKYVKGDDYVEKAKDLDGLWSGSFLFPKELETALDNITAMYAYDEKLTKKQAKQILKKLRNESGKINSKSK